MLREQEPPQAGELTRRLPELNLIVTYRDAREQDLAAACRAGITSLVPESHGLAAVLALLRRSPGRHARHSAGGLTDRELELVVLTGSGHSVSEIAGLLRISPLTVENLKENAATTRAPVRPRNWCRQDHQNEPKPCSMMTSGSDVDGVS